MFIVISLRYFVFDISSMRNIHVVIIGLKDFLDTLRYTLNALMHYYMHYFYIPFKSV